MFDDKIAKNIVLNVGYFGYGNGKRQANTILRIEDVVVSWRGRITRTAAGKASMAGQLATNGCRT